MGIATIARCLSVAATVAAVAGSQSASACLWEYATGVDGKPRVVNGLTFEGPMHIVPSEGWDKKLASLAADPAFATDYRKRNDYAVALIHLGRTAEAIPILDEIEAKNPGIYVTAVNLGTAYELAGKDDLALKWIGEGLKRNPESHEGTEWLHARILEAKLALKKDPKWLETHSVFDGGEALTGTGVAPSGPRAFVDPAGKPRDAGDALSALRYQLGERMQFVKPPEPIVAELLFEMASLVALNKSVEQAMDVMKMAGEYKPVRGTLFEARKAHFESLVQANPKSRKPADASSSPGGQYAGQAMIVLGAFALILFAFTAALYYAVRWWLRRRRQARESAAGRAGQP